MRYDAHETLVAPARPTAHPLRLLAGSLLTVALFMPAVILFSGFAHSVLDGRAQAPDGGQRPLTVILLLIGLVFLILALGIVLRLLHRRGLFSLIGPPRRAAGQFLRCLRYLLPLYLLLLVLPMPPEYRLSANLDPGLWLAWLLPALIGILIQVTAEELSFRGYLQSQLAARFPHPAIWIGLPSALFGLAHFDPSMAPGVAVTLALWAAFFGIAAADLTARSGTLGPALALHFINNVFAILITAPSGQLDGLALYTFPLDPEGGGIAWHILATETLFLLCAWLIARLALRV